MTEAVLPTPSFMRRVVALGLCLWLCTTARAESRAARAYFEWRIPKASGCIPARELEADVEAMLDRRVFTTQTLADHSLIGVIVQRGEHWVAGLQLKDHAGLAQGSREVTAEGGCSSLNRLLVVVIATMLDTSVADEPLLRTAGHARFNTGLLLAVSTGTLPRPAIGLALSSELTPLAAWPIVHFGFSGWLPQREIDAGVGARFFSFQARLGLCKQLFTAEAWRLAACAGVELGMLRAQALGFQGARTPSRLLGALPLEANVSIRVWKQVALRLGVGISFAALRPAFYFEDETAQRRVVHRVGAWGGSAQFGFIVDVL